MSNTETPQVSHKDAKAQAKAAKAYAKAQRPWFKKKRFIIPIALVALIVVVQIANGGGSDSNASDNGGDKVSTPQHATKPIAVEAKQILKEFEGNEAAADQKYNGKTIAVTGWVEKVDTEVWDEDEYIVQVAGGGNFVLWTVNCDDQSADVAAGITTGQKVTVTGDFEDGGDLGIEMTGCKVS